MSLMRCWGTFAILFIATIAFSQEPEGRLMRFPDIHGDKIAFVYGGDIWLASASGGVAHRRVVRHRAYSELVPDDRRTGGRMVRHAGLSAAPQFVFPGHRARYHRLPALRHGAGFHQSSFEYWAWPTASSLTCL